MFRKFELNRRLSRKIVAHIHRHLFDFGQGAHRVFRVGDWACLETDCASGVILLREQFPTMVESEVDRSPHDFPW